MIVDHAKTRLSLLYAVSYLVPSGLALLLFPRPFLALMLSRGDYGDAFPRLAGAITLGLGLIVAQIARHRIAPLYATLVWVRVIFCACWLWLFARTDDPFFLVLFAVVGFGVALTCAGFVADRRVAPITAPR